MGAGRPTKYDKKKHVQLAKLCAKCGMTDEETAEELEIDVRTLYRWKNDYNEFCQALMLAKEPINNRVENALLKRALGYDYYEEMTTKQGVVEVRKVLHPDTKAAQVWLNNRRPKDWKDKKEVEIDTDVPINIIIQDGGSGEK